MGILFPKIGTHVLKTYSAGSYVNGIWVEGTETVTTFTADIQPVSGEEAAALNIGSDNIGKIKIYTNNMLKIKTEGATPQSGDIVTWNGDGKDYEVVGVLNYDNNIINHRKYIAELRTNIV